MNTNFSISTIFSIVVHIVLLIVFPYTSAEPPKVYKLSEVELAKVSFEPVQERVEPEIKVVNKKSPVDILDKSKTKVVPVKDASKLMIPENKGYQLASPKFGVSLPMRISAGDNVQVKIKNDKGAPTDVPFGEPEVKAHDLAEDTNLFNNREGIYRPGIENGKEGPTVGTDEGHYSRFNEKYVPPQEKKPVKEIVKEQTWVRHEQAIEGTIGSRRVISKPAPPEIELDKDIDIEVKFFVMPDGQVREVIPILKGDTRLESIAIKYMKSWLFAPLSKDVEQVEQWGKLKINFKKISKIKK